MAIFIDVNTLTDKQIIEMFKQDTPFNRARKEFSSASARIEQAQQQRQALDPIEMRRMEFIAVQKIIMAAIGGK